MSQASSTAIDPRTAFRYAVRERAMTAGLAQVKSEGWRQLRINQIAKQIGVSRPTIYAEFGTKEEFAQTLRKRELDTIFSQFEQILNANQTSAKKALAKAFNSLIISTHQSPIIAGLLTDDNAQTPSQQSFPVDPAGLLPFVERCSELLEDWFERQLTGYNQSDVAQVSEALARLSLSHVLTPTRKPEPASKEIAALACRLLPEL